MAVDVKKRLQTVFEVLGKEGRLIDFSIAISQNILEEVQGHKTKLPKDVADSLKISDYLGGLMGKAYLLFRDIVQNPGLDYEKQLNEVLNGIDEPSELYSSNVLDRHIKDALDDMETTKNVFSDDAKKALAEKNFRTEGTGRTQYFEKHKDMEDFFGGKERLTEKDKENLKQKTAVERAEYAKRLEELLLSVFADAKEGDDLKEKFARLQKYFAFSAKYEVGLKLKEDMNDGKYRTMEDRMNIVKNHIYNGLPGENAEKIITDDLKDNIFKGNKEELKRRLRMAAEEIAEKDTFMYFKDKIANLPQYISTGDPQLLEENSLLHILDNMEKEIKQELQDSYGKARYRKAKEAPKADEIAGQLFDEYKKAGEIGDRLKYFTDVKTALGLPLTTPEARKALDKFNDMVINFECKDDITGKPSKEKILNFAKGIGIYRANRIASQGQYKSMKEFVSKEDVQDGVFSSNMLQINGEKIDEEMGAKLGLPLFAMMVDEYHLVYVNHELSKDKEKRAGFARMKSKQILPEDPVEERKYKVLVDGGYTREISDLRMLQVAGTSGIMKNHREFFMGAREVNRLSGILENMTKTEDGYLGHTNSAEYTNMMDSLRKYRKALKAIHENPFLATDGKVDELRLLEDNIKSSAKKYLSGKTGMRWHGSGTERQDAALGILSIFDKEWAKKFEADANSERWFKKVSLKDLEKKLDKQVEQRLQRQKKVEKYKESRKQNKKETKVNQHKKQNS